MVMEHAFEICLENNCTLNSTKTQGVKTKERELEDTPVRQCLTCNCENLSCISRSHVSKASHSDVHLKPQHWEGGDR